jgi:hypothetical protein
MAFFGGGLIFKYLKVKMSFGRKVLLFARSPFGWRPYVGVKREGYVVWTHDKIGSVTVLGEKSLGRFLRVDALWVDLKNPFRALDVDEVGFVVASFDEQVYVNLLKRAQTQPNPDIDKSLKQLLVAVLFIVILIGLGLLFLFGKVGDLATTSGVI